MLGSNSQERNEATGSSRWALVVGALMVTGAFVVAAAPSSAWHSNMPVVYEETVDGAAAFGVGATVEQTGDVAVALTGWSPQESAPLSAGVITFDDDKNMGFMFAFTAHGSPDRLIVEPTPAEPTPSGTWDDGSWSTHARGDVSVLEDMDLTIEVLPDASGTDQQPLIRVATTSFDVDTGPFYRGAWVGDVGSTTLEIESDATLSSIEAVQGTAHVKGDPDIQDGTPNIQVQDSSAGTPIGVKAINDATTEFDAEHGVYGFWALSDFKLACQFDTVGCLWASTVYAECGCSLGAISWESPNGGGEGDTLYSMEGTDPGPHSFTIDHKVDLYGPNHYDPDSGTWVSLGEHFSYLTAADLALP